MYVIYMRKREWMIYTHIVLDVYQNICSYKYILSIGSSVMRPNERNWRRNIVSVSFVMQGRTILLSVLTILAFKKITFARSFTHESSYLTRKKCSQDEPRINKLISFFLRLRGYLKPKFSQLHKIAERRAYYDEIMPQTW